MIPTLVPSALIEKYAELGEIIWNVYAAVFAGEMTVSDAADYIKVAIEETLKGK